MKFEGRDEERVPRSELDSQSALEKVREMEIERMQPKAFLTVLLLGSPKASKMEPQMAEMWARQLVMMRVRESG